MTTHLVTGARSGIGAEVARRLHDRGDRLVLVSRSPQRTSQLEVRFPGALHLVADLSRPEMVETIAADLPDELDSVVHAAGVVELGTVAELSSEDWVSQLQVNLVAPAALTRVALPALRAARGTVVFVNSGSGLTAHAGWSAYAASKHGLRALADALRAEEAERGIRVSSVFPGRTATPMQEEVHRQEGKRYDAGQWIRPETVADTILRLIDLPRDATIPDVVLRPAG